MSRISLSRRIDRIRDHLLVPGSLEWRLEQISEADRSLWLMHRQRVNGITERLQNRGDNAYAAFLADPLLIPPVPITVERAMFPELAKVRSAATASEGYAIMLQAGAT